MKKQIIAAGMVLLSTPFLVNAQIPNASENISEFVKTLEKQIRLENKDSVNIAEALGVDSQKYSIKIPDTLPDGITKTTDHTITVADGTNAKLNLDICHIENKEKAELGSLKTSTILTAEEGKESLPM